MWWHQRSARRTSANACALGSGVFAAAVNPSFSASSPALEPPRLELVGTSSISFISKGVTSGESARSATGAPRGCAAPAVAARRDASTARAFARASSSASTAADPFVSVLAKFDADLTARSSGGRVAGARLGTAAIRSPSDAAAASRTRALGCDASASGSSGGAWLTSRANSSDNSSSDKSSRYFRRRRRLASAMAAARSSAVSAASVASVRASALASPARQSGVSASTSAESIDG